MMVMENSFIILIKKFSDYLNYISNLSRFDLSLLGNIVEEYKNLLYKYRETMDR